MEKKKIYVLGTLELEHDSLPLIILPRLIENFKDYEFRVIDPTENFPVEEHLVIIDTEVNTNEVRVLTDIDKIQSSPSFSLHDFDLGMQLKLMKKLGKLKDVKIICVPPHGKISEEDAFEGVKNSIVKYIKEG